MREILFRGKRTDNGEWVEGCFVKLNEINYILQNVFNITLLKDCVNWVLVSPATVGQYTGLLDKNGERIFEGDITKRWDGLIRSVEYGRHLVEGCGTAHCGFYFKTKDGYVEGIDGTFELIGNIHDDPELLKIEI